MLMLIAVAMAGAQDAGPTTPVRPPDKAGLRCLGVFGSPEMLWKTGASLGDYGINAVFVSHGDLTDDLIARCHREGAKVYAEFGVFAGAATAEKYPELWPINDRGERQAQDEWYLGLCPTVAWYREEKLRLVAETAERFGIDGLWLDFIRYPGHWEVHQPRLEQACFCEACLEAFADRTGVALPAGTTAARAQFVLDGHTADWTRFKCEQIRDFCREARRALKAERPSVLLGAFVVPWQESDCDNAIQEIIAQDFASLASELDVFSPMSYHAMCGRPLDWIGRFNEYLTRATGRDVWPIVQATERDAHYGDAPVDAETFRQALIQGLSGGATGVLMFRLVDCTEDNGKLEVIRQTYREHAR